VRPKSFHSIGFTESNLFPRKVRIAEVDEVTNKCLNGVVFERNGKFHTIKPTWPYLLRLFPRFSDAIRKSPSSIYQLLSADSTWDTDQLLVNSYIGCYVARNLSRDGVPY
jgi:hypothetical protein